MSTDAVLRELLSRQLDAWLPAALHRSRRATLVVAGVDADTPEAAVRAVAAAGGLRGRRLTVLVLADQAGDLPTRLGVAEATLPAEATVHLVPGDHTRLPVALKAAGAAGAPVLAVLDAHRAAPAADALASVAAGRPGELLLTARTPVRDTLTARFPLVAEVEWVPSDATEPRIVAFATGSDRGLDAFKAALWTVARTTGALLRDPADPHADPVTTTVDPDPAPLAEALTIELTRSGPRTVTELRRHALTATVYRSADVLPALTGLLDAGTVRRDPPDGRLGGDVLITPTPTV
ncbi:hypothetical protein ABT336_17680 [Micromonospora sp. NPDC000207]|uniref:hypothetical protein n=1 Tax=Micromonospora sp. NPDC000207 TaxID=3154246 RepID=UPI0033293917